MVLDFSITADILSSEMLFFFLLFIKGDN